MTLEHDLLQLARDAMLALMNGRHFGTGQTGHYLNIISKIENELNRPQPEQEPVAYVEKGDLYWCDDTSVYDAEKLNGHGLYAAPPRKPWQGLTSEDWENTPTSGKQGCERDAELFDWIEQTLKDKNDTF